MLLSYSPQCDIFIVYYSVEVTATLCFENNHEYILHPADHSLFDHYISPILEEDEEILVVCQTVRDGMIFTSRRVIAVDIQGMLGTQTDVCALLYRTVRSFAIEREDERCILELFLAGQKQVRFTFDFANANLSALTTAIAKYTV